MATRNGDTMSGTDSTSTQDQYGSTPRTLRGQVSGLRHLIPSQIADEARIAANILKSKGIHIGVAAGAGIVAVALLAFMVIALVVALIMGLGTIMAPWLAALVVAGGFLVLALILAGFAVWRVKSSMPLVPDEAIRGFRHDIGVSKTAVPSTSRRLMNRARRRPLPQSLKTTGPRKRSRRLRSSHMMN